MPHALTSRDSAMESRPVGSYESTGIDILIVGTGLAGLVAALECTRKGHNVKVLERSPTINTAGKSHVSQISQAVLIRKQGIYTLWVSARLGS
jgi:choline dehydrogenase-like flavoprotein